jgi:uncharacterized membrane protein
LNPGKTKTCIFYLLHSPLHPLMVLSKSSIQLFTIYHMCIHICCLLCALSMSSSMYAYVVVYTVKVAYMRSVCVVWVCFSGMLFITAFTINLSSLLMLFICYIYLNKCMKYKKRAHIISFCKTCTWRVVASLDTFILSWFITGSVTAGASIASLEVLTKMFLYYAHERQWEKPAFNDYIVGKYMWIKGIWR